MAVTSSQIQVSTVETYIPTAHRLKNTSAGDVPVYLGPAGVTSTNGYVLAVGDEVQLSGNDIRVVTASGTGQVSVLSV